MMMDQALSTRKQRILHAVVSDYVTTAEPVGSQWLASRYDFGCRSATLRNEMCEMVEEGFLVQPHTSAGRIPTAAGYRYYVDRLMTPTLPDKPSRIAARRRLDRAAADVDNAIREACRLLAEITQYPSLASAPTSGEITLHRLFIAPAGARYVLLVLLLSTGHVENRIVELARTPSDREITTLAETLNRLLAGHSVHDLAAGLPQWRTLHSQGDDDNARRIYAAALQAAGSFTNEALIFEGASYMLRQREFRDLLRLEQLLSALMDTRAIVQVLRRIKTPEGVTVLIGPENQVEAMDECSLVTTRYQAGTEGYGYIGVLGPTRMDYDRAVAAVEMMADGLTAALARVSPLKLRAEG